MCRMCRIGFGLLIFGWGWHRTPIDSSFLVGSAAWAVEGPQSKVPIGRDSCSKLARLCRFWLSRRRQGLFWGEFERIASW